MAATDLTLPETERMAREISAIRLQLKRLREEQRSMADRVHHLKGIAGAKSNAMGGRIARSG